MGAESIRGNDICTGTKIIDMDLLQNIRIFFVEQRVGRPERQARIHAEGDEFCARGTVQHRVFRLGEKGEKWDVFEITGKFYNLFPQPGEYFMAKQPSPPSRIIIPDF